MMRLLHCLFASLVALAALPSVAQPAPPAERVPAARSSIGDGAPRRDIVDLSPRFAEFWTAAPGVDPDRRWDLWQRKYGFAAVPTTHEGERMPTKCSRPHGRAMHRYCQRSAPEPRTCARRRCRLCARSPGC